MADYKLDDSVPIPVSEDLELEDLQDEIHEARARGRRKKCGNTSHWPMDGKCDKCGDVFPCEEDCIHVDCLEAKDLPLPDWLTE